STLQVLLFSLLPAQASVCISPACLSQPEPCLPEPCSRIFHWRAYPALSLSPYLTLLLLLPVSRVPAQNPPDLPAADRQPHPELQPIPRCLRFLLCHPGSGSHLPSSAASQIR